MKRVVGSSISGTGLVVKRRQVLGTKKTSLTRNVKVSKNDLLVNKNLLKGQKLLSHFPGFGNYSKELVVRRGICSCYPTDWNAMVKDPDVERWMTAVKLEFDTLVTMGCWEVVDMGLGYYFSFRFDCVAR